MKCPGSGKYWVGDISGAVCATCGAGWRKLGVEKPKQAHLRGGGTLWVGAAPEHERPAARRNQGGRRIA
jgi:hypothetical protein